MDAKEAIKRAKTYVADMFSDEDIVNIGLEEVRRDDESRDWHITIGFSRLPSSQISGSRLAHVIGYNPDLPRIYKIVTIDDSGGDLISITNRLVEH